MDVDPVVGKEHGAVDDESDQHQRAVLQLGGVGQHLGRGALDAIGEVRDRHAGEKLVAGDERRPSRLADGHAGDAGAAAMEAHHLRLEPHLAAPTLDLFLKPLPHHAGPESRVAELADHALDAVAAEEGVAHRRRQGESLDALGRPVGGDRIAGDAPDLLGVALEKRLVETLAEPLGDPILERLLAPRRPQLRAHVARQDTDALRRAEGGENVPALERIAQEALLVVDAREARDGEEVVPQHLLPQALHLVDFGVEAVPPDVEVKPPVGLGARQAADDVIAFQHQRDGTALEQLVCGCEPGGSGADDHHRAGHRGYSTSSARLDCAPAAASPANSTRAPFSEDRSRRCTRCRTQTRAKAVLL